MTETLKKYDIDYVIFDKTQTNSTIENVCQVQKLYIKNEDISKIAKRCTLEVNSPYQAREIFI